jgi:hypothetical protein
MARKIPDMPMVMQPAVHNLTVPTQMLPNMPTVAQEIHVSTANKKHPTRTEAVQAAKAKITRRNSLRKQRSAQKTKLVP